MGKEIERKFLVDRDAFLSAQPEHTFLGCLQVRQGYLFNIRNYVLRARTIGDKGYLTFKTPNEGISRGEFEVRVPKWVAKSALALCSTVIEKYRTIIRTRDEYVWEVDEFTNLQQKLTLAEVELRSADETPDIPHWTICEVSKDKRYFNSELTKLVKL